MPDALPSPRDPARQGRRAGWRASLACSGSQYSTSKMSASDGGDIPAERLTPARSPRRWSTISAAAPSGHGGRRRARRGRGRGRPVARVDGHDGPVAEPAPVAGDVRLVVTGVRRRRGPPAAGALSAARGRAWPGPPGSRCASRCAARGAGRAPSTVRRIIGAGHRCRRSTAAIADGVLPVRRRCCSRARGPWIVAPSPTRARWRRPAEGADVERAVVGRSRRAAHHRRGASAGALQAPPVPGRPAPGGSRRPCGRRRRR